LRIISFKKIPIEQKGLKPNQRKIPRPSNFGVIFEPNNQNAFSLPLIRQLDLYLWILSCQIQPGGKSLLQSFFISALLVNIILILNQKLLLKPP